MKTVEGKYGLGELCRDLFRRTYSVDFRSFYIGRLGRGLDFILAREPYTTPIGYMNLFFPSALGIGFTMQFAKKGFDAQMSLEGKFNPLKRESVSDSCDSSVLQIEIGLHETWWPDRGLVRGHEGRDLVEPYVGILKGGETVSYKINRCKIGNVPLSEVKPFEYTFMDRRYHRFAQFFLSYMIAEMQFHNGKDAIDKEFKKQYARRWQKSYDRLVGYYATHFMQRLSARNTLPS